jgi:hypothetical protein
MMRGLLAVTLALALSSEASAQFYGPPPYGGGIGFQYQNRNLRVGGFVPFAPPLVFGVVHRQVNVQIVQPAVLVREREPAIDLSGVDLDVVPASAVWGRLDPNAEKPVAAVAPRPKREDPRDLPPARIERAEPAVKPAKNPPVVVAKANPDPVPAWAKLAELGAQAFRDQEFGVATLRFRQATEQEPTSARAFFLLAQGYYALGKYRDAVLAIEEGLLRQPNAPLLPMQPRIELYADRDAAWLDHRERLLAAHKRQPLNGDYLFLLGYQAWFNGQREQAADWFQQARPHVADPRWVDLFLKHLPV